MTNAIFLVCIILVVLWALGLVTSYTLGGGIHILLALAIIFIFVWFLTGKKKL